MATNASNKKETSEKEVKDAITPKEDGNSVQEFRFDFPVLDPESPLAVQVPEGTESDPAVPLAEALKQGSAEDAHAAGKAPEPTGWTE